jgi:hypothetical protein
MRLQDKDMTESTYKQALDRAGLIVKPLNYSIKVPLKFERWGSESKMRDCNRLSRESKNQDNEGLPTAYD